jgi:Na+/proline symporter
VTDANPPGRPPLNWLWLVTLVLVVGVAPAVGRDVTADLRESWGRWPAILAGAGVAALVAIVFLGIAAAISRARRPH